MPTEAVTRLYAGLDLHKSNVFCGLIDQEGKPIYRRRLPAELPTILQALEAYRPQLKAIAVESTFNWYWLVDGLQAADYPVHLANPAAMEKYSGLKQTDDETDALWLAEMLRLGILPTGYIYPKAERPVRDMLRRRMLIGRQATQTVLSLQSMVTRHTGQSVSAAKLPGWTLAEVRATFTDAYSQQTAAAMVELLGEQRRIQHRLEKQALAVVKPTEPFQRLQTLPGIGPILGLTIALETGPITRFASAGDYASYCRTVTSRCESDGKKKGQNNRKNGNPYLAWAYVEAANFAQRYSPQAQAWFARKTARTHRVVAVKALACKLAKAAYYVLRDDVDFDENKLFGAVDGGGRKPGKGLAHNPPN
jgi:transposase